MSGIEIKCCHCGSARRITASETPNLKGLIHCHKCGGLAWELLGWLPAPDAAQEREVDRLRLLEDGLAEVRLRLGKLDGKTVEDLMDGKLAMHGPLEGKGAEAIGYVVQGSKSKTFKGPIWDTIQHAREWADDEEFTAGYQVFPVLAPIESRTP